MNEITGVSGYYSGPKTVRPEVEGGTVQNSEPISWVKDVCTLSQDAKAGRDTASDLMSQILGEEDRGVGSFPVEAETSLLEDCLKRLETKKEQMKKKTEQEREKWTITKKLRYSPGKHMMRLAKLHQVTDVRKLISGVNANIYLAKNDKMVEKAEIKAAVVQMQQVIQRARVKIKNLEQETIEAAIGKSAAKRHEIEKARAMEQQLKRKIVARKAREYGEAKVAGCPKELIGVGKTPQERWEDAFQQTPEELVSIDTLAPAQREIITAQCEMQQASAIQPPATATGEIAVSGSVDVYV